MARDAPRLLIPPERLAPQVSLRSAEAHYLGRVRRARSGEQVVVVDGAGGCWTALVESPEQLRLEQPPGQPLERVPRPTPALRLAMAIPRRDPDIAWRMATELGADHLQPLIAERCGPAAKLQVERWRTIVREAMEQCERLWLPPLADPCRAIEWLARSPQGVGLIATPRLEGLPRLGELIQRWDRTAIASITLVIGAEGGWTPQEECIALKSGWQAVSLGPAILRTSSAAVAGVALLDSWRGLSSSSLSPFP